MVARAGFALRLEVMRPLVLSYATTAPQKHGPGGGSCRSDTVQIVRQLIGMQRSLHGHHAAANIHTDRRGNDCAAGRNYASDVAPMPRCTSGIAATHL